MLNFILPLLKNPLTRMIGSKVIGGIQHKIQKDKIIREKEIGLAAGETVDVGRLKFLSGAFTEQVKKNARPCKHSSCSRLVCLKPC